MQAYDLVIIGGGINGAGIARDAAGRGLSVLLIEKDDLAAHTSSASSKLIHGGLRYLEHYEFRLVAEALAEREVMLAIAPHIVYPMRFVLPHAPHLRPAWMIRLGLFLYDRLGNRWLPGENSRSTLPRSHGLTFAGTVHAQILKPQFARGFEYSDAWVDDARLVVLNARSAAQRGADIRTRTTCVEARREGERWFVELADSESGASSQVVARAIVNAAGPWAQRVAASVLQLPQSGTLRLVKGSHIVVPRLYAGDHAYLLQNADKRVVFVLPYGPQFTAIGTTDVPVDDPDRAPHADEQEIAYLCQTASDYLQRRVVPGDVVSSWSGVRALFDDGSDNPSAVTRDYRLMLDDDGPPALSVFGGKITTYRRLAEQALDKLQPWFDFPRGSWTGNEPLPGGDFDGRTFDQYLAQLHASFAGLDVQWLVRLLRRHGTAARQILHGAKQMSDLGEHFGGGLYEREVDYLRQHEWARTAEDLLWRRTKAGLLATPAQVARLREWLARAPADIV